MNCLSLGSHIEATHNQRNEIVIDINAGTAIDQLCTKRPCPKNLTAAAQPVLIGATWL
jgi:hypothetical protein